MLTSATLVLSMTALHFREEDPRKGKRFAEIKEPVTFPLTRTEAGLHPPAQAVPVVMLLPF